MSTALMMAMNPALWRYGRREIIVIFSPKWPLQARLRQCRSRELHGGSQRSHLCLVGNAEPLVQNQGAWSMVALFDPVAREFLDDIRIHGLGVGDIHVALVGSTEALLCQAAAVQRGGQPGIDL